MHKNKSNIKKPEEYPRVTHETEVPHPNLPTPGSVSIEARPETVKFVKNEIKENLSRNQWKSDSLYKDVYINGSNVDRSINWSSKHRKLTLREIKDILIPYAENGWYIEVSYNNKVPYVGIGFATFHATFDFLSGNTDDDNEEVVRIRFYLKSQNPQYISLMIPFWLLSLSLFLFGICVILSSFIIHAVATPIVGGLIIVLSMIVIIALGGRFFVMNRSLQPGRYGPLIQQLEISKSSY